jgi:hypothetical protein
MTLAFFRSLGLRRDDEGRHEDDVNAAETAAVGQLSILPFELAERQPRDGNAARDLENSRASAYLNPFSNPAAHFAQAVANQLLTLDRRKYSFRPSSHRLAWDFGKRLLRITPQVTNRRWRIPEIKTNCAE